MSASIYLVSIPCEYAVDSMESKYKREWAEHQIESMAMESRNGENLERQRNEAFTGDF